MTLNTVESVEKFMADIQHGRESLQRNERGWHAVGGHAATAPVDPLLAHTCKGRTGGLHRARNAHAGANPLADACCAIPCLCFVCAGWESVLSVTNSLTLPTGKMIDLFEQIVLELAELREIDTARALLRAAPALQSMRREHPERFLFLEHLLQRATNSQSFDSNAAYPDGGSKEKRRQAIALALQPEVHTVPPSRLLALLTQALKYQQLQGLLPRGNRFDLFHGTAPLDAVSGLAAGAEDAFPTRNTKVVKFGAQSYPEVARFSPDGSLLASGSCDGYIELFDPDSGKLNTSDFAYQAEDSLMSHDSAVLCLSFNLGMELLASGAAKGDVKVWRLATGSCVRRFPTAHSAGVTSVEFVRDGTQVLTASFDATLKIHGLKSGRTLKEFRGHSSFVNAATFTSSEQTHAISASSDGTIRVWDAKTCDCVRTIKMNHSGTPTSMLGIVRLPPALVATSSAAGTAAAVQERFVITERSGILRIINAEGAILATFQSTSSSSSSSPAASASSSVSGALPPDSKPAPVSATARKKGAAGGGGAAAAAQEGPGSLGDFVAVALSPHATFLYAVTEECVLHCFEVATTKLVHAIKVS